MTELTIAIFRQRAVTALKRARLAKFTRQRHRWEAEARHLSAAADHLESWEIAVSDMASMDAGAGDITGRSVW